MTCLVDSGVDTLDSGVQSEASEIQRGFHIRSPARKPRTSFNRTPHMTLSFAPERIEQWPLARLQPYVRNAKAHGVDPGLDSGLIRLLEHNRNKHVFSEGLPWVMT